MLTPMDDTLWHVLPTTFDHVGTSDPRFFDRYWFAATDPRGGGTLQLTLGVYNNMNVVDAGFVAIRDGRQYNVRASRSLRPRFETAVGPLSVEILEPLRRARLRLAPTGADGVAAELDWVGDFPAQEESARFTRVRGRVVEESRRFDQVGHCTGWLELAGERVAVDRWWATRDHSWGVREMMGIPEPVTGPAPAPSAGSFFAFLFFSTDRIGGHLQIAQFSGRPDYFTAEIASRDASAVAGSVDDGAEGLDAIHLIEATPTLEFHDAGRPRRIKRARFDALTRDGREVVIEARALCPAVDMQGLGYSGGYRDGRGLGVWRGEEWLESDAWDVSHPCEVVRADGSRVRPIHRIQPVALTVRGAGLDGEGTGSLTLIAEGLLPRLGLA
ncbi:MAG: hypothetical protein R3F35_18525 [Myxococcota bacterium]